LIAAVTRDAIMEQTLQLAQAPANTMRTYLKISFTGEPGIDAGGLLREWFGIVCKDVFSAKRGLFISTKGEDMSYWINPLSGETTENHLEFFRLAGILVGKALFEGLVMDVHLALPLLKHVLGIPISFSDLEFLDDELHRNCQWLKTNSNVENLCLTFSVMLENGQEVDLKENGRNIDVTDENKEEYLQLVLEHRMLDSIAEQLQEFLTGIYDVVPKPLLSVFDYQELELMLCGIPTIDTADWKANAHVRYIKDEDNKRRKITTEAQDAVIEWFWIVVESMTPEERARLLQFATGTSRVPVEGFRGLTSSSGIIHQFTIQLVLRRDDAAALFPKAHTCFNRIDLPMYSSMEELERYLTIVSQMEILGFGLE
jgi:E3 ubiquitin ligase SMURF1/2